MRIRLATIYAGPAGTYSPGIHDLPDELALPLLAGGYASRVDAPGVSPAVDAVALDPAAVPRRPRSKKTAMAPGAPETATAPAQTVQTSAHHSDA